MYKDNRGLWRESITINGKRKVFSAKSKKDLMLKIALYKNDPKTTGIPLNELADEWLEDTEQRVAYNTMKGYKAAYKKIVTYWKDRTVESITPQQITLWLKSYDKYAQKTISNLLLVMRLIINYGCVHYGIQYNPCDKIRPPKGKGKSVREFPSETDIEIVNNNTHLPYGLFLYTILYTGMRRGEACALQWKDIDWDNKRIHITKSTFWTNDSEAHLKDPKSSAGVRDVPLLDSLADVLRPLKGKQDEFVFGMPKPYELDEGIREYRRQTGLSCSAHGLRHGFASILFKEGLDIKTIQYVMGHAQSSTTMEIYVHLMQDDPTFRALEALHAHQLHTTP